MGVRPSECVLLIGIPTEESAFWSGQSVASPQCFVKTQCPNLTLFRDRVAHPARHFLPRIRGHGVTVVERAALDDLRSALRREGCRVVILLTHCSDDGRLELFDGLHTPETITSAIPPDYSGVFDIPACSPVALAMMARKQRKCLIGWRKRRLRPAMWLFFYDALFRLLRDRDIDYVEGTNEVYSIILETPACT